MTVRREILLPPSFRYVSLAGRTGGSRLVPAASVRNARAFIPNGWRLRLAGQAYSFLPATE
jgi:hypothetical protein